MRKELLVWPIIVVGMAITAILIILFIIFLKANAAHGQVKFDAPVWNKGDMWNYQRLGKSGKVGFYHALTVLEKSIFNGRRSYKLELKTYNSEGKLEEGFSKSFLHFSMDLEYLGIEKKDKTTEIPLTPQFRIIWPSLNYGRSWIITKYITYVYTTSVETIQVPSGKFECFKIVREWQYKDKLSRETFWYSPDVKNFVKTTSILGANDELIEYLLHKN